MDRWYGTDELRRSWCLLSVEISQEDSDMYIRAFTIGEGNADQLIDQETYSANNSAEETDLLQTIGSELDKHRYDGVSLITPSKDTLAVLRKRFLVCNEIQEPTLRGFHHISLSKLLETYFRADRTSKEASPIGIDPSSALIFDGECSSRIEDLSVEELWELRVAIGSLVPPDALRGTQL